MQNGQKLLSNALEEALKKHQTGNKENSAVELELRIGLQEGTKFTVHVD